MTGRHLASHDGAKAGWKEHLLTACDRGRSCALSQETIPGV